MLFVCTLFLGILYNKKDFKKRWHKIPGVATFAFESSKCSWLLKINLACHCHLSKWWLEEVKNTDIKHFPISIETTAVYANYFLGLGFWNCAENGQDEISSPSPSVLSSSSFGSSPSPPLPIFFLLLTFSSILLLLFLLLFHLSVFLPFLLTSPWCQWARLVQCMALELMCESKYWTECHPQG